jgi:hypothetical protein
MENSNIGKVRGDRSEYPIKHLEIGHCSAWQSTFDISKCTSFCLNVGQMSQLSTKLNSEAEFLLTNSMLSLKSLLSSSTACDLLTLVESNPSNPQTLYGFSDEACPDQKGNSEKFCLKISLFTFTSWRQSVSLF